MKAIKSSNLRGAQLDGNTILVMFRRNGATYRYRCPDAVTARFTFNSLTSADSPGRYFRAVIRHLPYERIEKLQ